MLTGGVRSAPITNLWRACGLEPVGDRSTEDTERTGQVFDVVDELIRRSVVSVSGTVPAANHLRLPRRREGGIGSLNARGRFMYVWLRLAAGARWAVHIEAIDAAGTPRRISVGSAAGSSKHARSDSSRSRSRGGAAQLTLADPPSGWLLLSLDLDAAAQSADRVLPPHARLRSLQLCGNLRVRGAYVGDTRVRLTSLPRDMLLSPALPDGAATQVWLPAEPDQGLPEAEPSRKCVSALADACSRPEATSRMFGWTQASRVTIAHARTATAFARHSLYAG
jgi:Protein of unknown function (DUF667)